MKIRFRKLDPGPEELLIFIFSLAIVLSFLLWKGLISFLRLFYFACLVIVAYALALVIVRYFIIFTRDYERAIIFRFGSFNRIVGPGWAIRIPLIEEFIKSLTLGFKT